MAAASKLGRPRHESLRPSCTTNGGSAGCNSKLAQYSITPRGRIRGRRRERSARPTENREPRTVNREPQTPRPDRRIRAKSDCFCVARPVLTVKVISPWMGFWRLGTGTWREKLVSSQSYERAGPPGTIVNCRRSVLSALSPNRTLRSRGGKCFCGTGPRTSCRPFLCLLRSRSFPAFSLASLTLLLVGYPIDGKANHFVRIRKTELFFDVRSMCLDGFDAEVDLFRDRTSAMSAP
jgi:hypothetical protein